MDTQEPTSATRHALIIEDDALLNKLFGKWFERLGFGVRHAFNGAEALSVLQEHAVDVVMLDQNLPDTTGAELYPKIAEKHAGVRVVVCSAFEPQGLLRQVVQHGEAAYIPKPCFFMDLVAALGDVELDKQPS